MADKSGATSESLSQQYRARAEECRTKAQMFRDPKARARMLDLASEYERKALREETLEAKKPKNE
jgi:hypothetical protein